MNGGRLLPGDQIEWTIVVKNTGLSPTTNVVVTDDVPSQTRYVSGSIKGRGADDSRVPHLRWAVGTLAVGESVKLSFRSTVKEDVPGGTQIRNQAVVRADQSEPKDSDFPATTDEIGDATLLRTGGNDWVWLIAALLCAIGGMAAIGVAVRLKWSAERAPDEPRE